MKCRHILIGILVALCGVSIQANAHKSAFPNAFILPDDWYPESLAAGPEGIYAGSWRQGAIALVHPDGRAPTIIVQPGANGLMNTQGLLVDAAHQTLWACSGDFGFTTVVRHPSALLAFDLKTGTPKRRYELADNGYCNDLAQDSHGDIYITDSRNPRILKYSQSAQTLVVWRESDIFAKGVDGFYLNGIAIDTNDVMYVSAVSAQSYLYKIALKESKENAIEKINFSRNLKNVDAIRSLSPGKLIIFESNTFGKNGPYGGQVTLVDMTGETPQLTALVQGLNDAASGVIVDKRVYFIEAKFSLLTRFSPDDTSGVPDHVPFAIQSKELVE